MKYQLETPIKGSISLSDSVEDDKRMLNDRALYKFLFVTDGTVGVEIDGIPYTIRKNTVIPLSPIHHIFFAEVSGKYAMLLFNSSFYCIYGHDDEVSCNGLLFHGSSEIVRLETDEIHASALNDIISKITGEFVIQDNLREEMLRILLKRFIIICTRLGRAGYSSVSANDGNLDTIRRFYILVDENFKEKKKVQEYAELLYRSPKTLSNIFKTCGFPSPLRVIHDRIAAEARRQLLYSTKSAKQIADILGFDDTADFSRFFKKMTGKSISEFRNASRKE